MRLITVENLSVAPGGHPALSDVSLHLDASEIVTVIGPNGSGKTSLLRALIGALPLKSGTIHKKAGLRLGYVPQKLAINPGLPLTVARFLNLPQKRPLADTRAVLLQTGAQDVASRQISALSGGQLQRVLLARALLDKPELLILDEPTTGLDQQGSASFYRLIEQVRRDLGCAVLMVSHELHVVMAASDRVICLNGHVCCHGTPEVVASAPEYRELFGTGTGGALALYRHEHDHRHGPECGHDHSHGGQIDA